MDRGLLLRDFSLEDSETDDDPLEAHERRKISVPEYGTYFISKRSLCWHVNNVWSHQPTDHPHSFLCLYLPSGIKIAGGDGRRRSLYLEIDEFVFEIKHRENDPLQYELTEGERRLVSGNHRKMLSWMTAIYYHEEFEYDDFLRVCFRKILSDTPDGEEIDA